MNLLILNMIFSSSLSPKKSPGAVRIANDLYSPLKIIHFVRHAEAEHNLAVLTDPDAYINPLYEDARLTAKGFDQCNQLRERLIASNRLSGVELVVVSPMRRTLQVAVT